MKKIFLLTLLAILLTSTSCKAMVPRKRPTRVRIAFMNGASPLVFIGPDDTTSLSKYLTFCMESDELVSELIKKANKVLRDAVEAHKLDENKTSAVLKVAHSELPLGYFRFKKTEDFFVIGENNNKVSLSSKKNMKISELKEEKYFHKNGAVHLHIDVSEEFGLGKNGFKAVDHQIYFYRKRFLNIGRKEMPQRTSLEKEMGMKNDVGARNMLRLPTTYTCCLKILKKKEKIQRVNPKHVKVSVLLYSTSEGTFSENINKETEKITIKKFMDKKLTGKANKSQFQVAFEVIYNPYYVEEKIAIGGIAFCIFLGLAYAAWHGYERYYTKAKKPRTRGIRLRRR